MNTHSVTLSAIAYLCCIDANFFISILLATPITKYCGQMHLDTAATSHAYE